MQRLGTTALLLALLAACRLHAAAPAAEDGRAGAPAADAAAFDAAFEQSLREGLGGTPAEAAPLIARLRALVPDGDRFRQRRFEAATCSAPRADRREALRHAEALLAAERAEAAPDPTNLALLYLCRGIYRPGNSEPGLVLADYDLAVEQARESGNTLLLGTLLSARAGAQSMNGAFGRALSDALEAQRLLEALGEDALNAIVLQNAGIAYRRMGEYGQAEEYLLRSLALPEIQDNWVYRLITLLQLGYLFEETDRFADARRVIGEALELCTANESRSDCGYARLALASIETRAGAPQRALDVLSQAEADFEASGDPGDPSMVALIRGQALAGLGRAQEALPLLDAAIAAWEAESNARYLALALPERSRLYERLGRDREALADLRRFVDVHEQDFRQRSAQRTEFMREQFDASRREIENAELRAREAARLKEISALETARRWQGVALVLGGLLLLVLAGLMTRQLARMRRLRLLALTDPLTGLANRRQTEYRGAEAFRLARASGQPFSVLAIDIDHFKQVNDSFGHAVGDVVLQRVGRECQRTLRRLDLMGRIGGEEFCGLLPETANEAALQVAGRLRAGVEALDLGDVVPGLRVTVSVGVAQARPADPDFAAVLARADAAMYRAKQSGRNRVVSDETT